MSFLTMMRSPGNDLPPIIEDNVSSQAGIQPSSPAVPERAMNRPQSRQFEHGDPPNRSFEYPPPPYSDTSTAPEKQPARIRSSKFVTERGGWRKLSTILIALVIVISLGLGLGVGLTRHHGGKSPITTAIPCGSVDNASFPVGTWSIRTALDQVSTNCTSDSLTWNCYPEITYAESSAASAATFDWIITKNLSDCSSYIVSTTDNPFTISFSNVSLAFVDVGLTTERYVFQVPLQKQVIPTGAITSSNVVTTCYYNTSTLSAALYTRRQQTYIAHLSNSTVGTAIMPWPYAADVTQLSTNAPDCFDNSGNDVGNFSAPLQAWGSCECLYSNHDL